MKRVLSVFLALLMAFSAFSGLGINAFADNMDSADNADSADGSYWHLDGTVLTLNGEMDDYNDDNPAPWGTAITAVQFNGVGEIGNYAFYGCKELKTVTFPEGITEIGEYAFAGSGIKNVELPKSCKTIKTSAFSNCTALETVKCANVTVVYYSAFADCTALTTVEFPETLDSVLEHAFKNCTALETVKLPEGCGLTIFSNSFTNSGIMNNTENWDGDYLYIGKHLIATNENETKEYTLKKGTLTVAEQALPYAEKLVSCGELRYMYSWKNNIKEVVYPEGTTYIFTLFLASNVEKVTIPASVKKIKYTTAANQSLNSIVVDPKNAYYSSAGNCLVEKSSKTLILGCNSSVIPDDGSVKIIDGFSFQGLGIKSITVPDGVEIIRNSAFYQCYDLETVTLPDSVRSVNAEAFSSTAIYNNFYNENDDAFYIGNHLLDVNSDLDGEFTVKNGTKTIGYAAFESSQISKLVLPDSLVAIGEMAFAKSQISEINIPDSVEHIGSRCFNDTPYYDNSENWENDALYVGNHLIEFKLGNATSFSVKAGTKTIADYALYDYAEKFQTLSLPKGLVTIGDGAFSYCPNLKALQLPDTIKYIGQSAFSTCDALTSVTIPKSVVKIENGAFNSSNGVTLKLESGNKVYKTVNNCIIENDTKTIIAGFGDFEIPTDGSVVAIADYAFNGDIKLKKLHIPESVLSIGSEAFYRCSNIETIMVDSKNPVYSAKNNCLIESDYRKTIIAVSANSVIPVDKDINSVAYGTFAYINGLKKLHIPANIIDFDYSMLASCPDLETITVDENNIVYSAQGNCLIKASYEWYDNTTAVVAGCKGSVIPTDPKITKIDFYAFGNCVGLKKITIPSNITEISYGAFGNCTNLEEITLQNGVYSIESNVFSGDHKIKELNIPESLVGIYSTTFADCTIGKITVSEKNQYLYASGNCLIYKYSDDDGVNDYVIYGGKDCVIPTTENVASIDEYAFCSSKIEKLEIPANIKNICDYAFTSCASLKEVNILGKDTQITPQAFFDCPNVTVYGVAGSAAETALKDSDIKYYTICEKNKHKFEGKITVKPTCVKTGEKTYQCKNCVYHYEEVLAKDTKAHKTTVVGKKSATCTAKGYTGDTKCTLCNKVVSKGKTIAAKGHKTTNKVTKATTTANGKIVATCSTCKKTVKTTTVYKISSVSLSTTKYYYTGKQKTPTVTVKDSKGKKLKNGTDYTVSMPSGRKKIGKYTVKVTFKGNYSGTKSLSFTIVPKSTSITEITAGKKTLNVEWKKQSTQTTGYQIQYSTSKSFSKAKTVNISKIKTTSKTISKLKSNKTYFVRVRTYKKVGKTKYYSNWSSAVSKKTKK